MNNINTIYTTVSNGQTHIAADTKYIGTVDSYNNCFTQFFAWLFKLSVKVDFDGKTRSVNKKSYKNLLQNLTQNDRIDACRLKMFRNVAENAVLPSHNLRMRDVIALSDREALFEKLAKAISQGDTSRALLMIGKGAELDRRYFDRNRYGVTFSSDRAGLSRESSYAFNVFKAPPILQAAMKGNRIVTERLRDAGANLNVLGQAYAFERRITGVQRDLEVVIQPTVVRHDTFARGRHHVHYGTQFTPQLQERTTVHTVDLRSPETNYRLNENLHPEIV